MNKNESKYFNTAVRMNEALIKLLEKKEFEYITIKEICAVAGVNRSTFYLHYENTSDLLKETTRYILDKHLGYYSAETKLITERFVNCDLRDLVFIKEEFVIPYLTFVKENQRVFRVSVKRFDSMNMGRVYEKMFNHIFDPILTRFKVPQEEKAYLIKFYLTGIFGIVSEWLNKRCEDEISLIAKIIINCVNSGRKLNE